MFQTFIKVMLNSKKETHAIIPDGYYPNIYEIDYHQLKESHINTLMFDIDNTITKVDELKVPKKTKDLFKKLKSQNFKILLISNNHAYRTTPIASALEVKLLSDAGKPDKKAYSNALNILKSKKENTVAIGDQIITDIVGAKKYGIKAILVDQLSKENNIQTGIAQKLQKYMIKKLTKRKLFYKGKYYNLKESR